MKLCSKCWRYNISERGMGVARLPSPPLFQVRRKDGQKGFGITRLWNEDLWRVWKKQDARKGLEVTPRWIQAVFPMRENKIPEKDWESHNRGFKACWCCRRNR